MCRFQGPRPRVVFKYGKVLTFVRFAHGNGIGVMVQLSESKGDVLDFPAA